MTTLVYMTALDKLETVATSITGLVVLGFLGAFDSKALGTDEYRATVKRFGWNLIAFPVQVVLTLVGMVVGLGAFLLSPTSQRIADYSAIRRHKGAHRALAY